MGRLINLLCNLRGRLRVSGWLSWVLVLVGVLGWAEGEGWAEGAHIRVW